MHASLVDATACVDDPVAVEAPDVEDPAEELLVELDDEERHQVSPAGVPAVRRVIYAKPKYLPLQSSSSPPVQSALPSQT